MSQAKIVQPLRPEETPAKFRRVFVRDLVLDCLIGVHLHEREGKQRVRINLDLTVAEGDGPLGDDLANVVCYETVIDDIRRIAGEGHVNLVETLAEMIAESCLSDSRVDRAVVRVEKLDVFDDAASVGTEIDRGRPNH